MPRRCDGFTTVKYNTFIYQHSTRQVTWNWMGTPEGIFLKMESRSLVYLQFQLSGCAGVGSKTAQNHGPWELVISPCTCNSTLHCLFSISNKTSICISHFLSAFSFPVLSWPFLLYWLIHSFIYHFVQRMLFTEWIIGEWPLLIFRALATLSSQSCLNAE